MEKTLKVGIADMKLCDPPDKVTTIGLGSCVGVCIYDKVKKCSGLVHIMLPDSTRIRQNQNKLKFADTGVDELVKALVARGANKGNLRAKIAGGAKIFQFSAENLGSIGDQNTEMVKKKLAENGIKIVAEDCGGTAGRTITFNPENFELMVVTASRNSYTI